MVSQVAAAAAPPRGATALCPLLSMLLILSLLSYLHPTASALAIVAPDTSPHGGHHHRRSLASQQHGPPPPPAVQQAILEVQQQKGSKNAGAAGSSSSAPSPGSKAGYGLPWHLTDGSSGSSEGSTPKNESSSSSSSGSSGSSSSSSSSGSKSHPKHPGNHKTPPSYPDMLDVGEVYIRDPTIVYDRNTKRYIVAGTDDKLVYYSSPHLTGPYTRTGNILNSAPSIPNPGVLSPWAPDIRYNEEDDTFTVLYCVSAFGTKNSAIALAISTAGGGPGTYADKGALFFSSDRTTYNALDPALTPDGKHLTFGSYFSGIYVAPITAPTGELSISQSTLPGTLLAAGFPNGNAVEGSFMYAPDKSAYYYLFVSAGQCCGFDLSHLPSEDTSEYKVLVGRSTSVTGPFLDKNGYDMRQGGGSVVLSSSGSVYAPGGQSIYKDPVSGRDVMVFHYSQKSDANGYARLGIYYLDFESGWPKVTNE